MLFLGCHQSWAVVCSFLYICKICTFWLALAFMGKTLGLVYNLTRRRDLPGSSVIGSYFRRNPTFTAALSVIVGTCGHAPCGYRWDLRFLYVSTPPCLEIHPLFDSIGAALLRLVSNNCIVHNGNPYIWVVLYLIKKFDYVRRNKH